MCTLHLPRFFFVLFLCSSSYVRACVCVSLISGALCARGRDRATRLRVFALFAMRACVSNVLCVARNVRQFSKYRKSAARVFFLLLSACVFMRVGGRFVYTPSNELPVVCACVVVVAVVFKCGKVCVYFRHSRTPSIRGQGYYYTHNQAHSKRLLLVGIITF